MSNVIAFGGLKGGSSKSCTTGHVGAILEERYSGQVLICDADPQGSLRVWKEKARDSLPPVVGLATANLDSQIPALAEKYQWVLIDLPSGMQDTRIQRAAALVADLFVIPTKTTDVYQAGASVKVAEEARKFNPGLKVRVFLSNVQPRDALKSAAAEYLASIGAKAFSTAIGQRVAIGRASLYGSTVVREKGTAAWRELATLTDEIEGAMYVEAESI